MRRYFYLMLLLMIVGKFVYSQHTLKQGDLLFQNLDCGPLCDAIEQVTQGKDSLKFSHIGLVYIKQDSVYIIEAIGKSVVLTPYQEFKLRTKSPLYLGRVKQAYGNLIDSAITFAISQLGIPYDEPFLYNNQKYYCSELIYDAFKSSNQNKPFFELEPMTFKTPNSNTFFKAWVDYYKKLNIEIPEGKPGINPAGISRSNKINWLGIID
jgi:hypothetical protein